MGTMYELELEGHVVCVRLEQYAPSRRHVSSFPKASPARSWSSSSSTSNGLRATAHAPCSDTLLGIGIDIEEIRTLDMRLSHFICDPGFEKPCTSTEELIERWTVKEACFKATPGNSHLLPTSIRIGTYDGTACCIGRSSLRYTYTTFHHDSCIITCAAALQQ